jgi:beta-glucosidase
MRNGAKTVLLGLLLALPARAQIQTAPSNAPWFNTSLSVEARANALVDQMTPAEKASQLVNQSRAIPRLGVPAYNWWNEALHGVATGCLAKPAPNSTGCPTSCPCALALGLRETETES